MKKLFKFLFILFIVFVVLVIVPVVVLYVTIEDKTDEAPVELYSEDITINSQLSKLINDSLNTSSDEAYIALSEEQLDLFLFAYLRNVNPNYFQEGCSSEECTNISTYKLDGGAPIIGGREILVKHAYASLDENLLTIYITLDVLGVKTNLNAGISIDYSNGNYIITFEKLGLGGLNLMSGFGKLMLNPTLKAIGLDEVTINNKIREKDIPVVFNMKDFSFTFSKEDLGEVLSKLLMNEQDELVQEFVNVLTSSDNDLLSLGIFDVNNEPKFGFKVDFTEIKYDPNNDGTPLYKLDYEDYKSKMETLLDNGLSKDNFNVVSNYLLHGYQSLDDTEKQIIDTIDFSTIGINNKTSFAGLLSYPDINLEESISEKLYSELANISDAKVSVGIDENLINQMIISTNIVGPNFTSFYQDNNDYKVVYTGIEAVWIDIVDDTLGFKILYNLNGTKMCLFTSFNNTTPNSTKIEADFGKLKAGSIEFSENMKTVILDMLKESITESSMNIISVGDNKIIIDSNNFLDKIVGETTLSDLIEILKNENMVSLDLVGASINDNGEIEFNLDLNKMKLNEDLTAELAYINSGFDVNNFVENKTQTLVISNLADNANKKIVFTESEFARLISQETNQFSGFENTTTLPDGTDFTFKVLGIMLDFTSDKVKMDFIVEVNGLKTKISLTGNVVTNATEDEIQIQLELNIKIGEITTANDFLLDMLGNNINSFGVMQFDATNKTFILSSTAFEELMAIGSDSTPLQVDKLRFVNGALEVYVKYENATLDSLIDSVTGVMETVLESDFLDDSTFNTTDPSQQEAVSQLSNTIGEISSTLQDPSQQLTEDQTDQLIDAINQLSDENQEEFLSQIENAANSQDLLDLYNQLFTN